MSVSRRRFLASTAAALAASDAALAADPAALARSTHQDLAGRFDPWIEIDAAALGHNARELARLAGSHPILAVVKNNAYGLGLIQAGPLLERSDAIRGFAVVKSDQAIALREAGVEKPILLMGLFSEADGPDLMRADVEFAPFTDGIEHILVGLAREFDRPVPVHLYIDTGMSRLGMPYRRALPWIASLAERSEIAIRGTFTSFAEEHDFDPVQLERFMGLADQARAQGIHLGLLHAASSHGLFFRRDAFLDMVRPGLCLYGAYPSGARDTEMAALRPAFRLRARVVRVEQLELGDSVSYGREYVAVKPVWIATLPVGHADGYPRRAVQGCEVLIGDRVYPVIGAVSASHTIVELGGDPTAKVGDVATLVGPDHPAVHPNTVAERAAVSVYDVLMHLSPSLPKVVA